MSLECDHGVFLDDYCEACEWDFYCLLVEDSAQDDYARENRRRSRQWVPLIVAAGVVLFALVRLRG